MNQQSAALYNFVWLQLREIRLRDGNTQQYNNVAYEALALDCPQDAPDFCEEALNEELRFWEYHYGEDL